MAKQDTKKEAAEVIVLPEGRMINGSLFEKDQYDEKSTPSYKIEVAFAKGDALDPILEKLLAHADATWGQNCGELDIDNGKIISGILDGDLLAQKREAKGKQGDAYKGMWVIRANTVFNSFGQNGPGGIAVWDESVQPVTIQNQSVIYPGCMVRMAATIADYEDDRTGKHALKFYLVSVQKVGDGEKLVAQRDTSTLFQARKPANGNGAAPAAAAEGGARRRRAG